MKKEIDKRLNLITIGAISLDVIIVILGFFLMSNPELTTQVSGILFGLLLMVSGLYAIMKYITNMHSNIVFTLELIYGIISVLFGILIMANPLGFANLITIFIGLWFIVSGVIKGAIAIRFKKYREETWLFNLVIAILTLLIGILLVVNPFNGVMVLTTYVGIMFIIYAGMDIVNQLLFRKRATQIEKIIFKN